MAVNHRETSVTPVADVRRRVAFVAYGAVRLIDRAQGALQDIAGAIHQGQYGMAALQGRFVVLVCLSVRSLAHEGEPAFDEWSVAFDFFAGIEAEGVAAALALANDGIDIDERSAAAWFDRLRAYVSDTERLLGFEAPLPALRSPQGAFALIGLARRWGPLLDELGLPALLPFDWLSSSAAQRSPQS